MNGMRGAAAALAILLILSGFAFASNISGTIKNVDGVRLSGTLVEVFQCGKLVAVESAAQLGFYSFDLPDGDYMFRFSRDGYPLKPVLITVKGTTVYDVLMLQRTQQSTIFGRVVANKSLAGMKVYATQKGVAAGVAPVSACGDFAMPSLWAGSYVVSVSPGYIDAENTTVELPTRAAFELTIKEKGAAQANGTGQPTTPPAAQEAALSAPAEVNVGESITVTLLSGSEPLSGESIGVRTPAGTAALITNSTGGASIKAEAAGVYVFTYKESSKSTLAKQRAEPPVTPVKNESAGGEAKKPDLGLTAGIGLIVVGVLVLLAAIVVAVYLMLGRERGGEESGRKETESAEPPAHEPKPERKRKR